MKDWDADFYQKLKNEFSSESGYDADEDGGYFQEWLVTKLREATRRVNELDDKQERSE